jgi:hypothetical protein
VDCLRRWGLLVGACTDSRSAAKCFGIVIYPCVGPIGIGGTVGLVSFSASAAAFCWSNSHRRPRSRHLDSDANLD